MLKLPMLPQDQAIVDADGKPSISFSQFWQQAMRRIEASVNGIAAALAAAGVAQAAAVAAQTAADTANTAAEAASTAAGDAGGMANANAREQALVNSYIEPASVLTATPTTITIAAHTRHYADGTSIAVSAGTVAATAAGDTDYVSYSDSTRAGGAVAFVASVDGPVQTSDTHVVGAIIVPATGSASGGTGPRKPGFVEP